MVKKTIALRRKDGSHVIVRLVTYRLIRCKRLRELGAPKWIIKYEQVQMIYTRTGQIRDDLIKKYVEPIIGIDSITIPDPDAMNEIGY